MNLVSGLLYFAATRLHVCLLFMLSHAESKAVTGFSRRRPALPLMSDPLSPLACSRVISHVDNVALCSALGGPSLLLLTRDSFPLLLLPNGLLLQIANHFS